MRYLCCHNPDEGGIGVIGGVRQSPKMLQESINELKSHLENKDAPFGIDLLIPQVGGNARKTNVSDVTTNECRLFTRSINTILQYDYTEGRLSELTDVIIKSKAALFVCAVGVPPKEMVDKLHSAGIPVMKYVQFCVYLALSDPMQYGWSSMSFDIMRC